MAVAPSAPVLLFLLLALLVAADADLDHYDEDDYDDDADYPVDLPPAVPDTTTVTVAPSEGEASPIATPESSTVPSLVTSTEAKIIDEDEKALHSLAVDAGSSEKEEHEGSKRAGSTQAKGAATITKAMHTKPAKGAKDRGAHYRSNNRHNVDSDEATNSIWGYAPTTPIDPEDEDEEEQLQAKKVLTPYELVTRRPVIPTPHLGREKEEKGKLPADLQLRLRKLDFYFTQLAVMSEDCRRRLLCQLADQPNEFQPLSFILLEETSFRGDYGGVQAILMSSTNGARLLTYMEATASGQDRSRGCSGFAYRCPTKAHDMIDMEALGLWRDMLRWMSVQVVALRSTAAST